MDWQLYQYHKLRNPHALRVIKLLPGARHEDEIQCKIVHTTLNHYQFDIGGYIALSYVWGNDEDKVPITIEDHYLLVTSNLDSALRHIRHVKNEILIWADAVCINQTDDEEKGQQVAQMGDVYKNAFKTIIFLGEGTTMSDRHMSILASSRLPVIGSHDLAMSILNRPWFSRIWTFQELILSKDPCIQVGKKSIPWDRLCNVLSHDGQEHQTLRDMDASRKLVTERDFFKLNTSSEFLRFLLITMLRRRGFGAYDPRDVIYAHLGVASEVMAKGAGIESIIKVDYEKPHHHLFAQFAFNILGTMQNYHFLSHVVHDSNPLNGKNESLVPSWSPDWSKLGLPKGQNSLRDAFMRKMDDRGNLAGGWENQLLENTLAMAPVGLLSDITSSVQAQFESGRPSFGSSLHSVGIPFMPPKFSQGIFGSMFQDSFQELEPKEIFPSRTEGLLTSLSQLYCKMANQLAAAGSRPKSIYFLPTLGYYLGVITNLSNVASHELVASSEITAPFSRDTPSRTTCNKPSRHDVIMKYRNFMSPIQLPTGDAPRFPNTKKLDPSMWEKEVDLSHRSQWLADHIVVHHLPEWMKRGADSPYKSFIEGKRFAELQSFGKGTARGKMTGLVSPNAKQGDIAVRFVGSDIPFLIRPVAMDANSGELKWQLNRFFVLEMTGELSASREKVGLWEFVGEAFVEQCMFEQGKALCERGVFGEREAFFLV